MLLLSSGSCSWSFGLLSWSSCVLVLGLLCRFIVQEMCCCKLLYLLISGSRNVLLFLAVVNVSFFVLYVELCLSFFVFYPHFRSIDVSHVVSSVCHMVALEALEALKKNHGPCKDITRCTRVSRAIVLLSHVVVSLLLCVLLFCHWPCKDRPCQTL